MPKLPKAIQLTKLLTDNELDLLKSRLVSDKRARLLVLLEALLDNNYQSFEESDKADLYRLLFKKEYDAKKDYLLRNEFRLLSKQIEDLLVAEEMRQEREQNDTAYHYYLLKSLHEKKAVDLFKKQHAETYQKALDHQDYYAAHNITGLNFINFTQFLNLKDDELHYLEKLNQLKLTHLSCFYLASFRKIQVDNQYVYKSLFPFSTEQSVLHKNVAINFNPFETDFSEYLFLKAKTFIQSPAKRIPILLQCLAIARDKLAKNQLIFLEEVRFCLSALARSHSLISNFSEADFYYNLFLKDFQEKDDLQRLAAITDYAANLVNLDKVEKALDTLEKNEDYVKEIPRIAIRFECLEIGCYAILGQAEKMHKLLPQKLTDFDSQFKNFYRFYYSIHAYLEGSMEDAYREHQNFVKATGGKELRFDIKEILNFFNRFYYLNNKYLPDASKKLGYLKKLNEEITIYSRETIPEYRGYLPFIWLKNEVKKQLM